MSKTIQKLTSAQSAAMTAQCIRVEYDSDDKPVQVKK